MLQRHSFALECLFRSEKPLTDPKLKAVREHVRACYMRRRLVTQGSDDLQNSGESSLTSISSPTLHVFLLSQVGIVMLLLPLPVVVAMFMDWLLLDSRAFESGA